MILLVADTSALLASADRAHPEHRATSEALSAAGTVLIAPLVLAEADHLARRIGVPGARGLLLDRIIDDARKGRVIVPEVTPEHLAEARAVISRYADLDLDLTDAVTVALAKEYRTECVLTLDRRDFRVVRPLSAHKAFRLFPDDG